jgi:hypothetical protein
VLDPASVTRERLKADARCRAAMFWMLREAGTSYAEIGRAADLSIERVRQICREYGYQLHRRSEYTSEEPFMVRRVLGWAFAVARGCDHGRVARRPVALGPGQHGRDRALAGRDL